MADVRGVCRVLVVVALLAVPALPLNSASMQAQPQPTQGELQPSAGRLIAPVARQAGVLNLDAPRPRLLTSFEAPLYVADVDVSASGSLVAAVRDPNGGDLVLLDGQDGSPRPLVTRVDASESLGAPVWASDGSRIVYEREDLRSAPVAFRGQAAVRYPTRVESVHADGSNREVLVDDARQPGLSPDATTIAYVRSSARGTALHVTVGGEDRALIDDERFPDLAYPRFSPSGDRIAFAGLSSTTARGHAQPTWFGWLSAAVAEAHGLPWDVWLIQADGSGLHELAGLGADDPSLAWSPDGTQLFVYGGNGAFVIDAMTGETLTYSHLAGYGAIAWVP